MIYNKTVLDNGTRIITETLPHAKSVSVGIWVRAGSRDEHQEVSGIFHLIEHMIFKGTETRTAGQIAKELDAIGGFSNAFTSKEWTCYYARVMDKHLEFVTGLLSDLFINAAFKEKDLELEKSVVLQEINMMEDSPEEYVQVLFDQGFWKGDSLGRPILGDKETVSGITREEIVENVLHFYSPGRVVIAAAGNIEHDTLVDYFMAYFEPLPNRGNIVNPDFTPEVVSHMSSYPKELEQVHICIGSPASSLTGKDRFAEAVFNTILGGNMSSKLFQEIREDRGLAYSVYSHISHYLDTGQFHIYAAVDREQVNRVLELVGKTTKSLCNGGLTHGDISMAEDYLKAGALIGSENPDSVMMRLAKNEFVFQRYISIEELVECLEKVTLDEVVNAANRILSPARLSLTVLGPVTEDMMDVDLVNFY